MYNFKKLLTVAVATLSILSLSNVGHAQKKPVIGLSIDDLRVERWQKDRDYFVAAAEKEGAQVLVQSANGSERTQIDQIEALIAKKVDTLVIVPFNGKSLSNVIKEAKRAGIKVIAYDRLILNADIDLYVSFDSVKVGEEQATSLLQKAPKGNYFLLEGSPLDNNARLFRQGQMNILEPQVKAGNIKIVGEQYAKDWLAEEGLKHTEAVLTANKNNIQAIVAANDTLAGAAIQALKGQKLEGKVFVSGQDAELGGIKRIIEGTQTMTVYKSIKLIAETSAKAAVSLAKGIQPKANNTINNGMKDVPVDYLSIVAVTKDNIDSTVIKDGFHTKEAIYGK